MRAGPLLCALGVAALLGACSDVGRPAGSATTEGTLLDSADQVAFGFRTAITDRGILRAEVFADTALFLEQGTRVSLRRVNADFYGATGAKEATMVGHLANYDTRNQMLEGWGDVVITSVDGRVLRTPQIRYNRSLNQITSDSAFVLTEPGQREVRGVGFRTDPNLTFINVQRLDRGRGGAVELPGSP